MRAGAVTPATLGRSHRDHTPVVALNEGRGCNPGDTGRGTVTPRQRRQRSMRAGAVTPATLAAGSEVETLELVRSMRTGAVTPATPDNFFRRLLQVRNAQ